MTNRNSVDDTEPFFYLGFVGDGLDPRPLIELIPLKPGRSFRKGDRLGRSVASKPVPLAKTGVCGFSTVGVVGSDEPDAHLSFLLDVIEPRLAAIQDLIGTQGLTWEAVLFEADTERATLPPLSETLLQRAGMIGLPLRAKGPEAVTVVHVLP